MNRLVSKKIASNSYGWKIIRRTFCSDAPSNLSGTDGGHSNNEHSTKHENESSSPQFDIAIIGGGMVGMALACSLARMPLTKQLSVAIIDSNPALMNKTIMKKDDPPDPRVSTVTPATISLFKGVGAWQYIEQHRHAYFDKMQDAILGDSLIEFEKFHYSCNQLARFVVSIVAYQIRYPLQVWDYTGLGFTRYNARDVNKEVLGCVVENKVLHRSLLSCMQDTDLQKTIYPSRLTSMTSRSVSALKAVGDRSSTERLHDSGNLTKLELSNGTSLSAKLVVGADGSKSRVRELVGIKTTGWNYSQNAIICTVEHTEENRSAWQRFLPNGPIALLPIGDRYSNIVWTMDPNESSSRKSMNDDEFLRAVNDALDTGYGPHPKSQVSGGQGIFSWLKADVPSSNEHFQLPPKVVRVVSERMVFPLSLMHANRYVSKRVVLIGDAAHTVHPLAGQGVNMGFGDAFTLSKVIAEGVAVGSDIGEVSLLRKYEADRKTANVAMMAILDGVQKAYSVDFGPLNLIRAAAFHGANYIPPLKRNIISYASGEQRLPIFA